MNQAEYQHVIDELDALITETRKLMGRFEDTGMNDEMPDDYAKLEMIITQALKEQRYHTQKMLDSTDLNQDTS
ncbi:hypothetical protein MHM84_02400 [Halomonas sp. McH1-25]|uniref:hypothetical protein n=1 Tax=unclassified Halomonas TaxID=2609666 RepID=UPI001EF46D3D|nr:MULTISPECIES: hypothetical protein [unclassified Halomonas]MCG7598630.1 hypothetical protein [Halomonas sp. McH1-25]MCP1342326.1 hypothetical protein [Halomonas sp. FL8]MCP1360661.1 hypothetical protein [Halomonas sp. BBD45]MCP1364011.1 hypothetical protein [Halomonas sp. BBD48]